MTATSPNSFNPPIREAMGSMAFGPTIFIIRYVV